MNTRSLYAAANVALALSLLAPSPTAATAVSPAAGGQFKPMHGSVVYRCEPVNDFVNQMMGGPKDIRVELSGRFPRTIRAGSHKRVGQFKASFTLYPKFVRLLKREKKAKRTRMRAGGHAGYGQSGGPMTVVLRSKKALDKVRSKHTRSAWALLRVGHKQTSVSPGRLRIRAPKNSSRIAVLMPKHLGFVQSYDPKVFGGAIRAASWGCDAREATTKKDRLIGTVKVR